MSSLRKSGAALFGALWMTYGAAAAAVITSSDDAFPISDAFVVLTLHDRPLDAFAKIAPTTPYDVRPRSDFDDNYADTIGDGLFFAPGVTVNALDLKEPRIIIRGFGQSNIHQRSTVVALRDGAPLTDVHGTTKYE